MKRHGRHNRNIARMFTWHLQRSAVTDAVKNRIMPYWKTRWRYMQRSWINAVENGSNVVKHCSLARLTERRFMCHDFDVAASPRVSLAIEKFTSSWSSCWLLEFRHLHKRLGTSTRTLFNADTSRRFLSCINA